jgi:hypothetical protein
MKRTFLPGMGLVALGIGALVLWSATNRDSDLSSAQKPEPAALDEIQGSGAANEPSKQEIASSEPNYIFDRSPTSGSLISKTPDGHGRDPRAADLWLRNREGKERFIAAEVTSAKFSPDGEKIAYCTRGHELFIETVKGQRLAQIPRASEPNWRADSVTLSFLATPSLDYPDLQQVAIYDLGADRVTEPRNEN